jgi:hypothetical protein
LPFVGVQFLLLHSRAAIDSKTEQTALIGEAAATGKLVAVAIVIARILA